MILKKHIAVQAVVNSEYAILFPVPSMNPNFLVIK